jgi:DNA-binding NtrC family response regulator
VKVLVVHDRDRVRTALATALRQDGYTVRTAKSVTTALAILDRQSFDLVVTESFLEIDPTGPVDPLGALFNAAKGARIMVVTSTEPTERTTGGPAPSQDQIDIEAVRARVRALFAP